MDVIDKSETRFEALKGSFRFILWVDDEDSDGQWFIRVFDETLQKRVVDGWWRDSKGKSVDDAARFAEKRLQKYLLAQ